MELLLMRHGESESNAGVSPSRDSPLTEHGREQVRRTAWMLQQRQVQLDRILCGPLLRAMETASMVGQVYRLRPEVWVELTERGFCGDEAGTPRSQLQALFPSNQLPGEVDELGWARHRRDESDEELATRMRGVARRLLLMEQELPAGRVLVVIHGGSGSVLLSCLLGIPPSLPVRFEHCNCGLTAVSIDREGLTVSRLNDTSHLEEMAMRGGDVAGRSA